MAIMNKNLQHERPPSPDQSEVGQVLGSFPWLLPLPTRIFLALIVCAI
jgi:hypothetical protein